MSDDLKTWLRNLAHENGFADCRIADPTRIADAGPRLAAFLAAGHHGDMAWMKENAARRADPRELWPATVSVVVLTFNYGPEDDPLRDHDKPGRGIVSCYAQGKDYHSIIKPKLIRIARALDARTGATSRVFVDTAPVMEKPLAAAAGIGWQGKHTNLVSKAYGSWTFLATIFTSAAIPFDDPAKDSCGTCDRCLDVCPTSAFPEPYRLDATRCIAYLTIEHKGHIPAPLRRPIANRIFGCDDCLAVCPWNKFAQAAEEIRLHPRTETRNPPLAELLTLNDDQFGRRFAGTPVKRTGRNRLIRNVLIAAGNSADPALTPLIEPLLQDPSPLVRLAAVWAMRELLGPKEFSALRQAAKARDEFDPDVLAEWNRNPETTAGSDEKNSELTKNRHDR